MAQVGTTLDVEIVHSVGLSCTGGQCQTGKGNECQ